MTIEALPGGSGLKVANCANPAHLFAQCSHYCELVSQPEQMPHILEIAVQTAIAKRGVAVVILPGDVALREAPIQVPRLRFPPPNPTVSLSDDELDTLAGVLNESKKLTILGGAGCAGAHSELIELANRRKAPVVHTMRGKEFIEYDNPFDVGITGLRACIEADSDIQTVPTFRVLAACYGAWFGCTGPARRWQNPLRRIGDIEFHPTCPT